MAVVSAGTGEESHVITPPPVGKVTAIITQLSGKVETLNWSLLRSSVCASKLSQLGKSFNFRWKLLFLMTEELGRTSKNQWNWQQLHHYSKFKFLLRRMERSFALQREKKEALCT